ncbi:MAG: SAM-dependent methyltransferase, partial [Halorhodospira sp.]
NADHLYGLAAECGLKTLMYAWGMQYDNQKDKPVDRDDRQHADGIWQRYEHYRQGQAAAHYQLSAPTPFADWGIHQRYWSHRCFDTPTVEKHRQGAEEVREVLRQARWEGWL